MTNAERRERRREAARKGAATRAAKTGQVVNHQDEPPQLLDPARLETAKEQSRRARAAEEKRLVNLRALIRKAQEIRRESDLYHLAHTRRWHHSPGRWTAEQIETAGRFLEGFVRSDGTPQPDPIRRKGRWRL